jgi:hypothetical protein
MSEDNATLRRPRKWEMVSNCPHNLFSSSIEAFVLTSIKALIDDSPAGRREHQALVLEVTIAGLAAQAGVDVRLAVDDRAETRGAVGVPDELAVGVAAADGLDVVGAGAGEEVALGQAEVNFVAAAGPRCRSCCWGRR